MNAEPARENEGGTPPDSLRDGAAYRSSHRELQSKFISDFTNRIDRCPAIVGAPEPSDYRYTGINTG